MATQQITRIAAIVIMVTLTFAIAGCSTAQREHAEREQFAQINDIKEMVLVELDSQRAEETAKQSEETSEIIEEQQGAEETVAYVEPEYYEPVYYDAPIASGYGNDFQSLGVVYGEDGTRYTWYSERVLPGEGLTELNSNGRHVSEDGYVVDSDGYIAVASGAHEIGDVIETPLGTAKVYDHCPTAGTIDVYVGW